MEELLKNIATQGLLGVLLALSFFVIYALFKMLMTEKDKRREDAEKLNDGLMEPIKQIKENGETQTTLLREFLNKVNKL